MNRVDIVGRLTRDVEVRYAGDTAVARFNVAVDRKGKKGEADFISCVSFGKTAEFLEKYFKKGMRIGLSGRIQTGSYEKDGQKIYTTDVVAEEVEFVESKQNTNDGFMAIPEDGITEELPFN